MPKALFCLLCAKEKPSENFAPSQHVMARNGYPAYCRECGSGRSREARLEVLRHYSRASEPFCQCCGERRLEFLAIDHKNGDGAEHRRKIGSGTRIYVWIRKNGYPDEFQVLCHNCNMALGFYGYCPHEEEWRRVLGQEIVRRPVRRKSGGKYLKYVETLESQELQDEA